jgi:ribosome-binding protein aMBF1 (putative translation factor)
MRSLALSQLPKPVGEDLRRLGQLIRGARARRGFTQNDLAARLRVSPTTVGAAERGDPTVKAGILVSLLWILGMGSVSASLEPQHKDVEHVTLKQRVRKRKSLDDF